MPGIQTAFVYCGMIFCMFGAHLEDCDLFSINYNHGDKEKMWYSVPARGHENLEKLVNLLSPKLPDKCNNHLRHKRLMFSPSLLKEHGVPFTRVC